MPIRPGLWSRGAIVPMTIGRSFDFPVDPHSEKPGTTFQTAATRQTDQLSSSSSRHDVGKTTASPSIFGRNRFGWPKSIVGERLTSNGNPPTSLNFRIRTFNALDEERPRASAVSTNFFFSSAVSLVFNVTVAFITIFYDKLRQCRILFSSVMAKLHDIDNTRPSEEMMSTQYKRASAIQ